MNESPPGIADQTLPQGTVTFLFTDIQGSTKLLRRLGDSYGIVLGTHRTLLRAAFRRHGGREVDTQGDAFFVAFPGAREAVASACEAQRALLEHPWAHGEPVLVRMAIHTGEPLLIEGHYVGIDVHRAARICGAAHGGQIVVSKTTAGIVGESASADTRFADLGRHRLKDLEHPEHLYQVVGDGLLDDFPTLRSLKPPTNVPRHVGALVGRSNEKQELERILRDGARAVTITGPGGTGKTRVAAAVALDLLDHFEDGVLFVDLSAAGDAALVSSAIAQVIGVQDEGGTPLVDAIAQELHDRHLLLLLDNFEQALEGSVVVSQLLHHAPRLVALMTSRIALSIEGEREFPLAPLSVPDDGSREAVERSEAAQLFIERGGQARPGFVLTEENAQAIASACSLLDGLPLALELAAARLKLFSPEALVSRLNDRLSLLTGGAGDRPDRHRTLRNTIDWSVHLLSEEDRAFFRDQAVFNGGATVEAAEAVVGAGKDSLDALTTLVGHSLLRLRNDAEGEMRFWMLQTIREYALEILADDPGRDALYERHARYYLEVAETVAAEATSRPTRLDRLDSDHDNMRTALEWWLDRADGHPDAPVLALRLAIALGRYWYTHGHVVEGGRWLERALSAAGGEAADADRARALRLLGIMMEQQRHLKRARVLFDEALGLFRKIGDRAGEASSLNSLGVVTRSLHDLDAAEDLFEASVRLRREIGDEPGAASSLGNLAIVAIDRGEYDRAWGLLDDTLALDRARGDEWGVTVSIANQGVIQLERGELDAAAATTEEALRRFDEMGEPDGTAEALETLAGIATAQERFVRAARIAGAAGELRRAAGIPLAKIDMERLERWIGPAQVAIGEAAFDEARREGTAMTRSQAIKYALEGHRPATEDPP